MLDRHISPERTDENVVSLHGNVLNDKPCSDDFANGMTAVMRSFSFSLRFVFVRHALVSGGH